MSYAKEVQSAVKKALAKIREIDNKKESASKNPSLAKYGEEYMKEVLNEFDLEKEEVRSAAFNEVSNLSEVFRSSLVEKYMPKAEEITNDVELLKSGIALSKTEIERMFDRNTGNNTMQRLISEYAEKQNVSIERVYEGNKKDLELIEDMQRYTRNMFDRPDFESELDNMYFGVVNE